MIGTSDRENAYPGYNKEITLNYPVFGKDGEFYTKVRNRPFTFESVLKEHVLPEGYMARLSCKAVSKSDWNEIDI